MSNILREAIVKREEFNPQNVNHIKSLECFVKTGTWGDVKFHAELPYIEVPMTVMMKYIQHSLGISAQTAVSRPTRSATKPNLVN
jgi:hypothetical protein